jgi:hypothetical protein
VSLCAKKVYVERTKHAIQRASAADGQTSVIYDGTAILTSYTPLGDAARDGCRQMPPTGGRLVAMHPAALAACGCGRSRIDALDEKGFIQQGKFAPLKQRVL